MGDVSSIKKTNGLPASASSASSASNGELKTGSTKQIILLRHAHRASSFDADASLSPVGLEQAATLPRHFEHASIEMPQLILVSPKRRAQQTISPLAQALMLTADIDARLDERQNEETRALFESRIRDFIRAATENKATRILACTHMDWLEAVMLLLPSTLSEEELSRPWAAGEFRVLNFDEDGVWNCSQTGVLAGGM